MIRNVAPINQAVNPTRAPTASQTKKRANPNIASKVVILPDNGCPLRKQETAAVTFYTP